jgi:hypothetical protein
LTGCLSWGWSGTGRKWRRALADDVVPKSARSRSLRDDSQKSNGCSVTVRKATTIRR